VKGTLDGVKKYEYFYVEERPAPKGRKCRYYNVQARHGGLLGQIRWHGPWRQFCLFVDDPTVWSAGCLRDVQDAIAWATRRHKSGREQ